MISKGAPPREAESSSLPLGGADGFLMGAAPLHWKNGLHYRRRLRARRSAVNSPFSRMVFSAMPREVISKNFSP